MNRAIAIFAVASAPLFLSGCDRICGDESSTNVAGDWLIKGEAHCTDEDGRDTSIDLNGEVTVPVSQSSNGVNLSLSDNIDPPEGTLSFKGTVNGSCVDFTITEEGPDYEISYNFSGVVSGGEITGDVRGNGTGICPFEGDFETTIYPGGSPRPPTDAGFRPDTGVDLLDAGFADTGTITDAGTSSTSTTTPRRDAGIRERECFRTDDCDEGICQNGECVVVCETTSDCSTGQKCIAGRCENAQGCNCDTVDPSRSTTLWAAAILLLFAARSLLARRRR